MDFSSHTAKDGVGHIPHGVAVLARASLLPAEAQCPPAWGSLPGEALESAQPSLDFPNLVLEWLPAAAPSAPGRTRCVFSSRGQTRSWEGECSTRSSPGASRNSGGFAERVSPGATLSPGS